MARKSEDVVGEGIELRQGAAVLACEMVVGDGGRDGDCKADAGHDQRPSPTRPATLSTCLPDMPMAISACRSPDRAEETDKGRRRGNGGEEGLAEFELRLVLSMARRGRG